MCDKYLVLFASWKLHQNFIHKFLYSSTFIRKHKLYLLFFEKSFFFYNQQRKQVNGLDFWEVQKINETFGHFIRSSISSYRFEQSSVGLNLTHKILWLSFVRLNDKLRTCLEWMNKFYSQAYYEWEFLIFLYTKITKQTSI